MLKKIIIIVFFIMISSLIANSQERDILKRIPLKNLGSSVTPMAPVPTECTGWNFCILFCPKGVLIVYDFPIIGCSCSVIQGLCLTITCQPWTGCRSVTVFCFDIFPIDNY